MKNLAVFILSIFLIAFILASNLPAEQKAIKVSPKTKEHRLALLIGNSNYTHGGSLKNSVTDVRAMKRSLEGLGFTVLKYENCTQKIMKKAMDTFGEKLKGQDVGLFFYSGHGVQVNGHNYLIPTNAKLHNENDTEYDCVRADRVLAKMESAGTKTSIVILDACRDNPFERSWRKGTKGTGLAFMNAPAGSLIAYSTAPGKTALDGRGKNSPYTYALLQHIKTPNVTVIEMFQGVRSTVMARTGGKQTPWESTSLRRNFYFNDQRRIAIEHHKEEGTRTTGKLIVNTEPEDARVRILNIKPRFYQGMELDPGEYHIEVSSNGYKTKKTWSRLRAGETKTLQINLEKATNKYLTSIQEEFRDSSPAEATKWLDADTLYKQTQALIESGKYLEAIKILNKAIELNPNYAEAYNNRGNAYSYLKQYTKSMQNFNKAIELDPGYVWAYNNRGNAYSNLKQYRKAIQDYDKAIELDPNYAEAYLNRGMIYFYLKQYAKSMQDFNKVIVLNPNYAEAYLLRAGTYLALQQFSNAIQDSNKCLELEPTKPISSELFGGAAYTVRGNAYLSMGLTVRGCSDLEKACDLGRCDALGKGKKRGQCF